ncbi:RNA-directed DNA polymerase [bacterium]|nr:RNA-directed DNA polymerase [bacterium]
MNRVYVSNSLLYYDVFKTGKRTIFSPCSYLKDIQKQILSFIKLVYKVKLNTKEAALIHCDKKWLLKIDISKFYESFSEELIKQTINRICENIPFPDNYDSKYIYQICTFDDKLPTGAITSAHIANIAFDFTGIDSELAIFCKKMGINYSRYMDDMFFSSDYKAKLQSVERVAATLLKRFGFSINKEKTKYISNNKPQKILGLLVNNKKEVKIPQNQKHKYRSIIFNYLKSIYIEERLGMNALFNKKIELKEIVGYISYIKSVDMEYYQKIKKYIYSKIKKFGLYHNEEIQKLIKVLKH